MSNRADCHQPASPRSLVKRIRVRLGRALADALFIQDPGFVGSALKWAAGRILAFAAGSSRRSQARGRRVWERLPRRRRTGFRTDVVALGPCARAALAASPDVHTRLGRSNVDLVVADSPTEAEGVVQPTIVLSGNPSLAVPAFDPRMHNPIGWRRRVENRVAALGPIDQLPPGSHAKFIVNRNSPDMIRHCHHVEDVASYHANSTERAGTLVRLAAMGTPIHVVDGDPHLESMLGRELFAVLTTEIRDADDTTRELHSVRMRRMALRDHSIARRLREMGEVALMELQKVPCVSIVLATNRPKFLKWAIANVQKQNYPRLELILALHGDDFDRSAIEHAIAPLSCPVEVVQISEEQGFPVVLNAATAATNGELVTKMDDDDLYDEHHVWDLVLAHQYSGGHLIGKGAEIVYLQRRNQTIERYRQAETYSRSVAGGTLLIARDHIDAIGGWQGIPPNVDSTLIDNVIRWGGLVYRTHGNGYVLIRHGQRHSWNAGDDYFLDGAGAVHNNWRPDLAGIGASSQRLPT